MIDNDINSELIKQWKFSGHSLAYQGLSRPSNTTKIIINRLKYKLFGKSTIGNVNLFFGEQMKIVFPEQVSEMLFMHHFFEYNLTSTILLHLKPGMIFVDVGAHFGYFTLLASYILKKSGSVHSFEATKRTFDILKLNTKIKQNITVNNLAAWSKNTELEFFDYGEVFAGYNSFTNPKKRNIHDKGKKFMIKTNRLDDYFREEMPDFVKIDAESSEIFVVKGMEKIINEKPPIITIEVGDYNEGEHKSKECIDFLLDRNYDMYEFNNKKIIPHKVKDSYEYDNLVCIPSSRKNEL